MNSPENRHDLDRFSAARRLVKIAVFGSLLITAAIGAHAALTAGRTGTSARAVLESLDLSVLSLVPSGRPGRVLSGPPEADLRFDPGLTLPPVDPAGVLRKANTP